MTKVADRPTISEHHQSRFAPFTVLLPHDTSVEMHEDLHVCYSIVNLARQALAYDDGGKDCPSYSASVALEMVQKKIMNTINTLDNLQSAN